MGISIDEDTRSFLDMLKAKVSVKSNEYPNKLLISGMGGSGIGGRIMESLANYKDLGDIFSWNNYGLPKWRYTVNLIIHTLIVNIFMNFVFWVLMVHIFARN